MTEKIEQMAREWVSKHLTIRNIGVMYMSDPPQYEPSALDAYEAGYRAASQPIKIDPEDGNTFPPCDGVAVVTWGYTGIKLVKFFKPWEVTEGNYCSHWLSLPKIEE